MSHHVHASTVLLCLLLGACGGAASTESAKPANLIEIRNASFTEVDSRGWLVGWEGLEHNTGNSYRFVADSEIVYSSPASARVERYGPEIYGHLRQLIPVQPQWVNKTVRLSAMVRTDTAADASVGLIFQMNRSDGSILSFNHMFDDRLSGKQDWRRVSVDLKVLPSTYRINVGAILEGSGKAWFDDFQLEIRD